MRSFAFYFTGLICSFHLIKMLIWSN
jgi:hypothetical protein